MANMAVSRIKREFKEVIKSEEVSFMPFLFFPLTAFTVPLQLCVTCLFDQNLFKLLEFHHCSRTILSVVEIDKFRITTANLLRAH